VRAGGREGGRERGRKYQMFFRHSPLPPSLPPSLPLSLRDYRLRLILCLVDDANNKEPLLEINKLAIRENCTLLLAWSTAEAAR